MIKLMLKMIAFALTLPSLASAESIAFDHGHIRAEIKLNPGPARDIRTEWIAMIQLETKPDARAIDGSVLPEVELSMENGMSHPHGPGGPIDVVRSAWPGVFEVRGIYFTMSGEWTLRMKLTYADGQTETGATPVIVP